MSEYSSQRKFWNKWSSFNLTLLSAMKGNSSILKRPQQTIDHYFWLVLYFIFWTLITFEKSRISTSRPHRVPQVLVLYVRKIASSNLAQSSEVKFAASVREEFYEESVYELCGEVMKDKLYRSDQMGTQRHWAHGQYGRFVGAMRHLLYLHKDVAMLCAQNGSDAMCTETWRREICWWMPSSMADVGISPSLAYTSTGKILRQTSSSTLQGALLLSSARQKGNHELRCVQLCYSASGSRPVEPNRCSEERDFVEMGLGIWTGQDHFGGCGLEPSWWICGQSDGDCVQVG